MRGQITPCKATKALATGDELRETCFVTDIASKRTQLRVAAVLELPGRTVNQHHARGSPLGINTVLGDI